MKTNLWILLWDNSSLVQENSYQDVKTQEKQTELGLCGVQCIGKIRDAQSWAA